MNDVAPSGTVDIAPVKATVLPVRPIRSLRRRYLFVGVVLALVAAAGATWWWIASRGAAMHYATTPVTQGAVVRTVTATGTINPVLTIIVGTAVSGVIQSLQCDFNTKVTKGQICAKIDPRSFQAVVDQDTANLAVAKAQLEKDQASLEYTKANAERTASLARENSIAMDTADQSRSAYHQGQGQILLDQAMIQQWQAQLEGAQVNLDYTNIISPVDGTVVSRNVTQGQTVAASLQTPTLFLIATDLTQMEVDTNVSESDIGTVKEKNPVTFTVEAYPERTFAGTVVQVRQAPQTLQNVVTFDVVVDVTNPDLALMPGMTATTRIVTTERDNVIRVPDQALRYLPAGTPAAARAPTAPAPASTTPAAPASMTPAAPASMTTAAAPAPVVPATASAPPAAAPAPQGQVWVLVDSKPVRVTVTLGLEHEVAVELAGGKRLVFETGRMAKQASGAALVTTGETVVLATAVASPDPREGIDFFPLTVDYREYTYAGGRIPGGFIKREGRPSEKEVLTCRQIDRPLRPLFPDGFRNETQLIALVFSADKENDPDVVGINAAACALALSDIPFSATVGAVRVGRVNGEFVINPTYDERANTTVNIMVVGHKDGIVMIESGAKEETEEVILAAIEFAHAEIKKIVAAIDELVALAGKPKRAFTAPEFDEAYYAELKAKIGDRLKDAQDTKTHGKTESYALIKQIKEELAAELPADDPIAKKKLAHYYEHLIERTFREQVTKERIRPDRRAFDEIRSITIETSVSAPDTRLGALYPRRDASTGHSHSGHR